MFIILCWIYTYDTVVYINNKYYIPEVESNINLGKQCQLLTIAINEKLREERVGCDARYRTPNEL